MSLSDLKSIIFRKLKLNKACDIFKLTTEHLRYCGDESLTLILGLINSIIRNLNYLARPQLNTALASVIYKGKNKPVVHHKSYRLVRVSPLFGRIIDEHLRPNIEKITKPIQNTSQYGFTTNVTYMMAALQRHETEKFCIDNKHTFFGCSLDGESAFEVVNRSIQLRELFCSGETGQYWSANNYSYQNSQTRIKMDGFLSQSIDEHTGVKQGNIKSSDHYKIYINPFLNTIDSSTLGVWIGQTNVAHSSCADDVYLISDSQTKLQSLLNIAQSYGKMYDVVYGATKTKITVIGSSIDQSYYKEICPWKLNDETINVTEDNEHLGQVISGTDQEQKNIDLRISKSRNALYGLLGTAFQHKSLLNQKLKFHLFRTYVSPVLRSGLSSYVIRSGQLTSLTIFHRKVLRGILNLRKSSNIPALYFLLGELPLEGQYHKDIFSLFYNIWTNPDTKIYHIVKHLLETVPENSRTWSAHLRLLARKYCLEDPLETLKSDPLSKSLFKEKVCTKITVFFEKNLREMAANNSRMQYLNVSLSSLRGSPHPALSNIHTSHEVKKSRPHIKMLSGDYLTYEIKSNQSGGSSHCRSCSSGSTENTFHILTQCEAYKEIRDRILDEMKTLLIEREHFKHFKQIFENNDHLCQFILDPTSLNLPIRFSQNETITTELFKISRHYCFAVHAVRMKILKKKN